MGWRTPANKLLANCYQFTACNCETILILYISFKAWELSPCMSGRCPSCLSGLLGLGQAADTMVWGGGYLRSGGNKNFKHIHTEAT